MAERIGFIGAGQMGQALIQGFLSAGVSSAGRICASIKTFVSGGGLCRGMQLRTVICAGAFTAGR